ncbi:DUF6891 domain-containing protein [Streptomyces endophytica]|uniref:DUF6891 domain-containing protein n=1 Tax=Streptomyces endophytica TaxID=2991496 RepID=A0ABY6PCX0_9ACTN|nr:hypothetical protein [Streptomyces endophytica]UZJ31680.1 hypothetical protein OJ254_17030 [Streptomyces endophytica]
MLAISVKTESGADLSRPTAAELAGLLRRIGADGDHFAVVERLPDEDQVYVQTWRDGDGPFAVEHRDGAPERHFTASTGDAERVVEVFLDWARGGQAWRTALDWRPADLFSTPGLDPAIRAEAEERARAGIRSGFRAFHQVVQDVRDGFDPAEAEVSREEARRIVARLWEERLAEQAGWPEVTDPDRVARAFAALADRGLTARMDFTCCSGCGLAEIGGQRAEGDRGFVFFHHQDTAAAAEGHGLSVRYGAYPGPGQDAGEVPSERRAEVGQAVAAALTEAGLPVRWDGDPDRVIDLAPLDWRKRLPTGA